MLWNKSYLRPHRIHQIRSIVCQQQPLLEQQQLVQQQQQQQQHQHHHTTKPSSPPLIQLRPSSIVGAGWGVFANQPIRTDTVVTLYPGIYTPPLPSIGIVTGDDSTVVQYLADQVTPSGRLPDDNAYLLNLPTLGGGYLDGLTMGNNTLLPERPTSSWSSSSSLLLACGHLINHNASHPNIQVVAFVWNDVLPHNSTWKIPNQRRCDGSPWYYDGRDERVVYFPTPSSSSANSHDESRPTEVVCGAAMVTTKDIEINQELLLDYGLHAPYPRWANDWYAR